MESETQPPSGPPKPAESGPEPAAPPKTDGRGHRKRNKAQVDADRLLVERWHLSGKTVPTIIELLASQRPYTLSESQVYADINRLRARWREEAIVERTTAMGEVLRGLRRQEEELWAAWERSKEGVTRTTLSKSVKPAKSEDGATATDREVKTGVKESSAGDATFMRLILDIQQERAKLLGLYAPVKQEHSGPNGGPIPVGPLTEENQQAVLMRHFERMKRAEQTTDATGTPSEAHTTSALTA
jgi:hypothetical protein